MNIIEIQPVRHHLITTDEQNDNQYRRYPTGDWERYTISESKWKPIEDSAKLESSFNRLSTTRRRRRG